MDIIIKYYTLLYSQATIKKMEYVAVPKQVHLLI